MADGEATNGASVGRVNHDFVRLLETALADAKAGRIVAGCVGAVIGPSNFVGFTSMWTFPAECIAACEVMKADVITKMRQPRVPSIVRAPAAAMRQ